MKTLTLILFAVLCVGCVSQQTPHVSIWGRGEGDASETRLFNDLYDCNTGAVEKAKRDVLFYGLGYGSETLNEEYLIPCMTNLKGWYLKDKKPWSFETDMTEAEFQKRSKPALP